MLLKKSREHLHGVNEGYFQHMQFAFYIGGTMILGGVLAIAHALVPALFQRDASGIICRLHEKIQARMDQCQKK
jgi:hypothetical protein